jgi:hypothetical protein
MVKSEVSKLATMAKEWTFSPNLEFPTLIVGDICDSAMDSLYSKVACFHPNTTAI